MNVEELLAAVRGPMQDALTVDESFIDAKAAVPEVGTVAVIACSATQNSEDGKYVGVIYVENPIIGEWTIPGTEEFPFLYVRFWKEANPDLREFVLKSMNGE